jgi:hypothetical protein
MMQICKSTKILKTLFPVMLLLFVTACTPTTAESPALQALIDKAAIEDLLVEYYTELGTGGKGFSDYYLEDSILDVNGQIAQGREGIENLYKLAAEGADSPAMSEGAFRMMLTNIRITVNGDSATGNMLWTGVNSPKVTSAPELVEQGREHDEFIKRDGKWYFKHRMITSDGGLSGIFAEKYTPR